MAILLTIPPKSLLKVQFYVAHDEIQWDADRQMNYNFVVNKMNPLSLTPWWNALTWPEPMICAASEKLTWLLITLYWL